MRQPTCHVAVLLGFLRVASGTVHGEEQPSATAPAEQPSATAPAAQPSATAPSPDASGTAPSPDSGATAPALPSAKAPANELPHHPAAANPPHHKSEISDETFKFRASVDLPIALGAAATWGLLALLQNQLSSSCRWCDRSASGGDALNGLDRGARNVFKWSNTGAAGTLSDISTFVATPLFIAGVDLAAAGSPHRWRRWAMDILIISEATAISGALNYIVKYASSRQRPFVHYEMLSGVTFKTNVDDNASFFSGHTTFAFAVATAGGTVASLRHYKLAPLIWAVGMSLATFSGYLRIAADQHYLSDVIVGSVVGSAIGAGVPLLRWIRPLRERKISFSGQGGSNGALLAVSGAW
jgi:membrane-associated phospholipid phosphatase